MPNLIGISIGRYHILEQLGEGGMAVVYKAFDTRLERDVALKIIRLGAFPPEQLDEVLKRFEREAKTLARLSHPNIVKVLDYGEYEGSPYFVLEYLPGGTLRRYLGRPVPWQEAIRLVLPVARALEYAHEEKVLHRDVKPSNILMTTKGQPLLTDFGIAKILDLQSGQTLTAAGVGIGTPEYMSPEQGLGTPVDGRADIYSLGVVLYELITGTKPFTATTPMAVALKHLHDPLPRATQFVSNLPEAVEKMLFKALAKEPKDRFQTMGEFANSLDGLLTAPGIQTVSPVEATVIDQPGLLDQTALKPAVESQVTRLAEPGQVEKEKKKAEAAPFSLKRWLPWVGGILGVALIAVLVIVLVKHGSKPPAATGSGTATQGSIPVAVNTVAQSALPYTCTDPIGCVTIGPTDPIHIAYLLVISGPNAALGTDSRNGVNIAIDDAGGKILNHTIKFDGEDGGCSADGGQTAGTKLASDPTILAVIGTSCSSEARAAEPLLSKAGFVTISPSNTAIDLTDPTSPNHYAGYFRTAHNDKVQGAAAADFAYNFLKVTKAATIHDGSLYADQLQQNFAENFKTFGGTITLQTSVTVGTTDMSSVLASVAAGKPDIIYFPIFMPEGALIIQQAKTTPGMRTTRLMVADGLYSPDVMKAAGASVEGVYVSSPLVQGAAYDAFVAKYKAKFGTAPINIFHAHAYDAFNIVMAAIEKVAVQESDGTLYIPRQGLRDAMAATANFQGLTGVLTCSASGDCANPIIGVYQYHTGQYPPTLIWPPKYTKHAAFNIGMVTDTGGINDKSFNNLSWQGVQQAVSLLGVSAKYLESHQPSDYAVNIQQLISEKDDLVVTVGFLMGVDTATAAKANPNSKFAIIDYTYPDCYTGAVVGKDCGSSTALANVRGLAFQTDQAAFLAGYLAAGMSKSGMVGTWGGVQIPTVTIFMKGFQAGATYYNKVHGTNVNVVGWEDASQSGLFINGFTSTSDGQNATAALVQKGADIILPVAGGAGLGSADYCESVTPKCLIIGVDQDWFVSAPKYGDIELSSIEKRVDVAVLSTIQDMFYGKFTGGTVTYSLANGGVDLAPYHNFDSQVPQLLKDELGKVRADLVSGAISVDKVLGGK